jgi:hypothetical protein
MLVCPVLNPVPSSKALAKTTPKPSAAPAKTEKLVEKDQCDEQGDCIAFFNHLGDPHHKNCTTAYPYPSPGSAAPPPKATGCEECGSTIARNSYGHDSGCSHYIAEL